MKNNYILNIRKGNTSGYTFINSYSNEFHTLNGGSVKNTFTKLEECGYKLLNTDDYPDGLGIPVCNIFGRAMLFRDIEFYNAFETNKKEILVRWYKVEQSGHIRMKQVLFTKPEHLKKPINELVTAASMKNYNIEITCNQYKLLQNIIVPYNIKCMLLANEHDLAVDMYLQDDFNYLSGELPNHIKTRKNIIAQSFLEVANEDIRMFIVNNNRPTILQWSPLVQNNEAFDAHYIRDNTYYD